MSDDELKAMFESIRRENAAAHDESRRHFDVVAERLESRFEALAEGVGSMDQKLERRFESLEEKVGGTAADTQAMIKFSHAELDRRLQTLEHGQRTLEETVSDLQTRVERLESSTH